MLSITDHRSRLCDGLRRREILRAGGLGLLGSMGWRPATAAASAPKKAKACIVLFLMGGPPQHSTWDPKPLAPNEVRGAFGPISTAVPGVQISELLPLTAQCLNDVAILRAVNTNDNAHSSSGYAMLTGQPHVPLNRENANPGAPNNWPSMGATVQELFPEASFLPTSVRLPHHIFNTDQSVWPGQDSGFLGHKSDPWLFACDPAAPSFKVPQFELRADVTLGRLENRRRLLEQLESQLGRAEKSAEMLNFDRHQQQAFELLSQRKSREACNLDLETPQLRDRYGRGQFGQSCLLARRLVEAGVKFVQVNWFRGADEPADNPCWDSHSDETNRLKNVLVPPFDQAFSTLIADLKARGLFEETLVVATSEFGRTPRFNARAGRDHWGHAFSIAMTGGGIAGGRVHGSTDAQGAYTQSGTVTAADVTATIFHALGFEPDTIIHDNQGRPIPISRGEPIKEILA